MNYSTCFKWSATKGYIKKKKDGNRGFFQGRLFPAVEFLHLNKVPYSVFVLATSTVLITKNWNKDPSMEFQLQHQICQLNFACTVI